MPEIRMARPENGNGAIDDMAVAARLVAATQPGTPVPLDVPGADSLHAFSQGNHCLRAILRPVVEVLSEPRRTGLTKGQVLIKLYDLEPQAKVRSSGERRLQEKHRGEGPV